MLSLTTVKRSSRMSDSAMFPDQQHGQERENKLFNQHNEKLCF